MDFKIKAEEHVEGLAIFICQDSDGNSIFQMEVNFPMGFSFCRVYSTKFDQTLFSVDIDSEDDLENHVTDTLERWRAQRTANNFQTVSDPNIDVAFHKCKLIAVTEYGWDDSLISFNYNFDLDGGWNE